MSRVQEALVAAGTVGVLAIAGCSNDPKEVTGPIGRISSSASAEPFSSPSSSPDSVQSPSGSYDVDCTDPSQQKELGTFEPLSPTDRKIKASKDAAFIIVTDTNRPDGKLQFNTAEGKKVTVGEKKRGFALQSEAPLTLTINGGAWAECVAGTKPQIDNAFTSRIKNIGSEGFPNATIYSIDANRQITKIRK